MNQKSKEVLIFCLIANALTPLTELKTAETARASLTLRIKLRTKYSPAITPRSLSSSVLTSQASYQGADWDF
jgi:hypothetical protein